MSETSERSGLQVDEHLRAFVEDELLAQVELTGEEFWSILARLQERFAPRIATALAERDDLQGQIDAWHAEHGAGSRDDYEKLLTDLGYLAPEPSSVPTIDVDRVDPEIAEVPGPQLVVPSTNARFALNAANARWGSLFDAFYGTDALPQDHELAKGYDEKRGAQVIEAADELLDELFPLERGSHADVTAYRPSTDGLAADTADGAVGLADPSAFAGFTTPDADGKGSRAARPPRPAPRPGARPVDQGRRAAPRGRQRRRARVRGDHDRRPRGLGRDGRRRGQGPGLPHVARSDDRRPDLGVHEGRRDRHPAGQPGPRVHRRRRLGS